LSEGDVTRQTIVIERATFVRGGMVLLGLWAVANLFWLGRDVLFLAFFAVLVSTFLSVFVDLLCSTGLRRAVAVPIVVFLLFAIATAAVLLLAPALMEQVALLRAEVPPRLEGIMRWVEQQWFLLTGTVDGAAQQRLRTQVVQGAAGLVSGTLPLLTTLAGALSAFLIVLFAAVFMTLHPRLYRDGLVRLAPPQHRPLLSETLTDVGRTMQRWLVATLMSMGIIAVMTTVGLLLLGIPAALTLGLLAGLLQFIPNIGPILSSIPAAVIALAVSPMHALYVLLLYLGTQQVESNMITPLIMRRAVHLPPALTLLAQALMTVLFGFLGLLLAVPLVAVTLLMVRRLYVERMEAAVVTR
jgi:predicted PurR-regulated permease PerM